MEMIMYKEESCDNDQIYLVNNKCERESTQNKREWNRK